MKPRALIVIMIGFFLMGVVSMGALFLYKPKPLRPLLVYGEAPSFQLLDTGGQVFDEQALQGKVWVVDFFFSTCGGPCPRMAKNMAALQKRFQGRDDVHLVNFTVNPDYDTPEVLARYAKKLRADTKQWHFLTGPAEEIHRIAAEGFKLGDTENLLHHSQKFALVDRQGKIRGYYEGTDQVAVTRLARDLGRLLAE